MSFDRLGFGNWRPHDPDTWPPLGVPFWRDCQPDGGGGRSAGNAEQPPGAMAGRDGARSRDQHGGAYAVKPPVVSRAVDDAPQSWSDPEPGAAAYQGRDLRLGQPGVGGLSERDKAAKSASVLAQCGVSFVGWHPPRLARSSPRDRVQRPNCGQPPPQLTDRVDFLAAASVGFHGQRSIAETARPGGGQEPRRPGTQAARNRGRDSARPGGDQELGQEPGQGLGQEFGQGPGPREGPGPGGVGVGRLRLAWLALTPLEC